MMTFVHRDRRRLLVGQAITAANNRVDELDAELNALPADADPDDRTTLEQKIAAVKALLTKLNGEDVELTKDGWLVSDESARALASDWLWSNTTNLLSAVKSDAALLVLDRQPLLTIAAAAALEALPRGTGDPRQGFLEEVANTVNDPDAMSELIGFALALWLNLPTVDQKYPFREIGVMLPLRLETIFDLQPNGRWKLSLRVIPDEPSIRRDQPKVSQSEVECLKEFWSLSRAMAPAAGTTPDKWLEHPDGAVAWAQLCDRVGVTRAASLVSKFPPALADGAFTLTVAADRIGDQIPDRVAGLPQLLKVVVIETNNTEHQIGTLSPDESALTLPLPTSAEGAFDSWLISWTKAKAVGMGGEFTLPVGCTPNTIEALYVYGVGDEGPTKHFVAHAEAGGMGLLRLGAPTNTIHGMPAADLGRDAETWRAVAGKRLRAERDTGLDNIANALCGTVSLPLVPGGSNDFKEARRMVQALWPALWGHYFRDLRNCRDSAHNVGLWAMDNLYPEGPLLPLRIGTQPYGLLPVSSFERWTAAGDTDLDQTETRILDALIRLRPAWVSAGTKKGTVVGADAKRLLELLARPGVSPQYVYNAFLPAELLAQAYPAQPQADFIAGALSLWRSAIEALQREPVRTHLAVGHPSKLRLPLIGARRLMPPELTLGEAIRALYQEDTVNLFIERMRGIVPDSLLIRLLVYSVILAKAWYMQSVQNIAGPLINPLRWEDPAETTPIEQFQANFANAEADGLGRGPIVRLLRLHQKAVFDLIGELDQYRKRGRDPLNQARDITQLVVPPERRSELDRALRATLDTASHRIDPWFTGIAWRRLREHSASVRSLHRLGAYGWLDGPFIGTPGPNRSGRLHAPSHTQALTSIILRDKFLSSEQELTVANRNIWKMDLTSTSVRLAIEMAEEVRMGLHIFEVVGRRVEGIVGRPDRVRILRKAVPLRPERPDRRDVCHGLNALDGLLANSVPGVLIDEQQVKELNELKAALEAYSDLLVAEGVHQVVTGHADIAAEVMDAAAGFARPPSLEFVRTPPSGYRLPTSVITVLPYRRPVVNGSPLELVDASLAAFLEDQFGDANQWSWRAEWTEEFDGGELQRNAAVTLQQLSLSVLDVVLVPEDFLIDAVRTMVGVPAAKITPPPFHALIRQLAGTLGSRPAALSDLVLQSDLPAETVKQSEESLRLELFVRYQNAHIACSGFAAEMDAAGLTNAERIAWLRRALAWGVVGPADAHARKSLVNALFGLEPPVSIDLLTLTQGAKATLTARLKATPDIADPATAQLSPAELARALAEIASPDGKLTITARWSTPTLLDASSLQVEAVETNLDDTWLTVMAAVRPVLSRLEALQLEARLLDRFEPLSAWTNSPGDPWQKALVGRNVNTRRGATGVTKINTRRFVAGFGPVNAWQGADVAVALMDQFSEAVPMAERSTYAAFGFNAPAARAPQAILLAVPPRSDKRLESDDVLQILKETRQLVRARAANVVDDQTHPTMWFQGLGPLRMSLSTSTQYWR